MWPPVPQIIPGRDQRTLLVASSDPVWAYLQILASMEVPRTEPPWMPRLDCIFKVALF